MATLTEHDRQLVMLSMQSMTYYGQCSHGESASPLYTSKRGELRGPFPCRWPEFIAPTVLTLPLQLPISEGCCDLEGERGKA